MANGDLSSLLGSGDTWTAGDLQAIRLVLQKLNFDLTPARQRDPVNIPLTVPASANLPNAQLIDGGGPWRKSLFIAVPNTGYAMLWGKFQFVQPAQTPTPPGIWQIPSGVVVNISYSDTQEPIFMTMAPGTPAGTYYVSAVAFYVEP